RRRKVQQSFGIGIEHRRMHVAVAAYARSVAEALRDGVDRAGDELFFFSLRFGFSDRAQRTRRQQRAGPGAEILRTELLAGDGPDVFVDVVRIDFLDAAVVVVETEKF